jgi:hypothetical protein
MRSANTTPRFDKRGSRHGWMTDLPIDFRLHDISHSDQVPDEPVSAN